MRRAERSNIDDAAFCRAQMRQRFARHQERTASVGFKDSVPLIEGKALQGCRGEDGGIVDEHVETSKRGEDGGDGALNRRFRADVALDGDRAAAESGDLGDGFGSG
jgi:hypothetical protein